MSRKHFELLDEDEKEVFLKYIQRFKAFTDIRSISSILDEAINELTSFRYSLLFLYQPEKNLLLALGSQKRSPMVKKGEKFIGLNPSEITLDLSTEKKIKGILRKKRPLDVGDLESVDIISVITGKKRRQIQSLLEMLKVRRCMIQPITVSEGEMEREIVVGLLICGSIGDRIDKKEKLKLSILADNLGLFLHNELIRRRLEYEIEVRESNQRLFETINQATLDIQNLSDEDQIFNSFAARFKQSNIGTMLVKLDRDSNTVHFQHLQMPKSLADSVMKVHSFNLNQFSFKAPYIPRLFDLFNLKKPIILDDFQMIRKSAMKAAGLQQHMKSFPINMDSRFGIVCPIIIRHRCDTIIILSKEDITSDDLLSLEVLSLHVSNALERLIIERENQEKTEQIRFMNEISGALSKSLDISDILSSLWSETSKLFDFDHISLVKIDQTINDGMRYLASRTGSVKPKTTLGLTVKEIETVSNINDIHIGTGKMRQRGIPETKLFGKKNYKTRIVAPLRVKKQFLGLLLLGFKKDAGSDENMVKAISSVLDPLSTALLNANVLAEEKRRSLQLSIISEFSKVSTTVSSIESVFTEMLQLLTTKFGYASAFVVKHDPVSRTLSILKSSDPMVEKRYKKYKQPSDKGLVGKAVSTKKTVMIPNVDQDPDYIGLMKGVKSELCVPVIIDGNIEVIINLESKEYNDFDEQDVMTIETIANEVSVLIKNIRMGLSEQKRIKQFDLIHEIGREIVSIFDVDKILETTVSLIEEKFSYIDVTMFLVDEMGKNLILKATSSFLADDLPIGLKVSIESGIIGYSARKGQTVLLDNAIDDPRYIALIESDQRSELCCPIKINNEVIGVLNIESPIAHAFDQWDQKAMESLTMEVGKAIEKGSTIRETERRSNQMELINEISHNISTELKSQRIMEIFTENLQRSKNYTDVSIFLVDDKKKKIVKKAQSGDYKGKSPPDYSQGVNEGLFGVCLKKKETLVINDVSKDKRFKSAPWVKTRSEMIAPIIIGEDAVGLINVDSELLGAFDGWDRLVLDTLSRNLSITLQKAHLLENEKDRSDILLLLNEISANALKAKDLQTLMTKISKTIIERFGFYNISVFIEDEKKLPLRLLTMISNVGPYSNLRAPGSEFPANEGLIGACFLKGKPVLSNDTTKDKRFIPEPRLGTMSELCIPLNLSGKTIGVLNIEDDKKDSFTKVDVITMETIADIISRAMQNTRQLEQLTRHSIDISTVIDIEKELTSHLEMETLIKKSVKLIHERLGFHNVEFYTIDEENYDLELMAHRGGYEKVLSIGFRQNIDAGIIGRAFKEGKLVMINEASKYTTYFDHIGKSVKAAIAVPILVDKKIIGILSIEGDEPNQFKEWDTLILDVIGELLSGALERADRYKEHKMREQRYRLAYDIGIELSRSRSVEELYKKAAKLIKKQMKMSHVEIYSYTPGGKDLTLIALAGVFKKKFKLGRKVAVDDGIIGWCLAEGSNGIVNDRTVDPRCGDSYVKEVKSNMVALIRSDDEVVGLVMAKSRHFDAFSDWDLIALEAVVRQIENIIWHLGPKG